MNHRYRFGIFVALIMHVSLLAQEPPLPAKPNNKQKPLLFAALPETFEVNQASLQKIFETNVNDEIHLQLSSQFLIQGKVVDKNQHTPGTLSVNIRVSNYSNALFNVSLRLLADNSTGIQGRILHPQFGDILQLYKEQDKYFIKKNSRALVMPE